MAIGGGSELAGYRVVSLLGRGGAGAVYLADDLRLGRKVALKVLNPETADAPGVRERFVAESRIAASLDHPHIIPIYEAGEADGQLFIAMRYVPGSDLGGAIREGRVTAERTLRVVDQVASALDAAHEAGLIHRDVKPANILLAAGSQPGSDHAYLTDFGLTKQATYAGSDPRATKSGQLLGTIGYIAPEQIQGLPIDGRVDIYSLGCVLYECLAGTAPYPRESDLAVLLAHVEAPPPSLAATRPELPAAIDAVVAKALAKHPDDRYPSAGELARAAADALTPSASRVGAITRGFLFSDLRGYTDFVDAHGDRAGADLLESYRRLVRDVVRRYGGAEIKTEGDSFYVVFPSASSAVGCGLAIAQAAETASREQPARPIRVAIGIHAGESTRTEEGYVGLAVNTAARICAVAHAGEVLVSETVRSIARTGHDYTFTPRGRRTLKGIAEPVALYAASGPAAPGAVKLPTRPITRLLAAARRHPRRAAAVGLGTVAAVGAAAALVLTTAFGAGVPRPSSSGSGASGTASGPLAVASPAVPQERILFSVATGISNSSVPPCQTFAPARLYMVAPDGTGYARLIGGGSDLFEHHAAFSPDGRTIAFSGDTGGFFFAQLHLVAADGTRLRALPPASDEVSPLYTSPAWSADGNHIAWVVLDTADGVGGVRTANADGSAVKRLWSPKIDMTEQALSGTDFIPPYPRPVRVAWMSDDRLTVIVAEADEKRSLGTMKTEGAGYDSAGSLAQYDVAGAAFSPDGTQVALSARPLKGSKGDGLLQLYLGKVADLLPTTGSGSSSPSLEPLTNDPSDATEPAWSPDGQHLVFTSTGSNAEPHVQVMDLPTRISKPLPGVSPQTPTCSASWVRVNGPVSSPPPSPSPGSTPAPVVFEVGPLEAGRYRATKFSPSFEVSVPAGWEGRTNGASSVTLTHLNDRGDLLAFTKVQAVYTKPCLPGILPESPTKVLDAGARALITWLQSNPYLTVTDPRPIDIGTATGLDVNVSVRKLPTKECPGGPNSVALFPVGGDFFRVDQGDILRLIGVDAGGTTVTIIIRNRDGSAGDFDFVLGSVQFP